MKMKKTMLALVVFAAMSHGASAQDSKPASNGCLPSASGVVHSGFGLCSRAGSCPEADKTPECDVMPEVAVENFHEPKRETVVKMQGKKARLTERVAFGGTVFFEFDKAELTAQGKNVLNDMLSKIAAGFVSIDVVDVSGHADRIGDVRYNHDLALRRAVAVSGYLATRGIPARALTIYGEDHSFVDCEGVKGHKALVSCLGPNRRAKIFIQITRKR